MEGTRVRGYKDSRNEGYDLSTKSGKSPGATPNARDPPGRRRNTPYLLRRSDGRCHDRAPPAKPEDPHMNDSVDDVINSLSGMSAVQPTDTTPRILSNGAVYHPAGEEVHEAEIDRLFGTTPGYNEIRKENPTHRVILWMRLNGHKPREIATALRISYHTVLSVQRQPWFQRAFCRILAEKGGDQLQTILEGELIPTIETLVELRDSADSSSVRLSAANAILDRIRGKPTVHVEQKVTGQVDSVVYDAQKLLEEQRKNAEILKARGIGGN